MTKYHLVVSRQKLDIDPDTKVWAYYYYRSSNVKVRIYIGYNSFIAKNLSDMDILALTLRGIDVIDMTDNIFTEDNEDGEITLLCKIELWLLIHRAVNS